MDFRIWCTVAILCAAVAAKKYSENEIKLMSLEQLQAFLSITGETCEDCTHESLLNLAMKHSGTDIQEINEPPPKLFDHNPAHLDPTIEELIAELRSNVDPDGKLQQKDKSIDDLKSGDNVMKSLMAELSKSISAGHTQRENLDSDDGDYVDLDSTIQLNSKPGKKIKLDEDGDFVDPNDIGGLSSKDQKTIKLDEVGDYIDLNDMSKLDSTPNDKERNPVDPVRIVVSKGEAKEGNGDQVGHSEETEEDKRNIEETKQREKAEESSRIANEEKADLEEENQRKAKEGTRRVTGEARKQEKKRQQERSRAEEDRKRTEDLKKSNDQKKIVDKIKASEVLVETERDEVHNTKGTTDTFSTDSLKEMAVKYGEIAKDLGSKYGQIAWINAIHYGNIGLELAQQYGSIGWVNAKNYGKIIGESSVHYGKIGLDKAKKFAKYSYKKSLQAKDEIIARYDKYMQERRRTPAAA